MRIVDYMRIASAIVAVAFGASSVAGAPLSLSVAVTWLTPGQPELQLLAKSNSSRPQEFLIRLVANEHQVGCDRKRVQAWIDSKAEAGFESDESSSRDVIASIDAGGWVHKTYQLQGAAFAVGCAVSVVASSPQTGATVSSAEIQIAPHARPPVEKTTVGGGDPSALQISSSVQSEYRNKDLVVKVLVVNRMKRAASVAIGNEELSCKSGYVAWDRGRAHSVALSEGPQTVAAGSWVVFSLPVSLGSAHNDCVAVIEVMSSPVSQVSHETGSPQRISRLSIDIKPARRIEYFQ